MPTADKSSHSAAGKPHPYHSATYIPYVTLLTLHCPIPPKKEKKFVPSLTGDINPPVPIGTIKK